MRPQRSCISRDFAAICQLFVRHSSSCVTMDAATTAAVLAIVADDSMDAAMLALLQERERLAMLAAHHESYLAQRHYVGSLQVPRVPGPPMTWQAAYERRHDDLGLAHDAMRTALRAIQRGDSDTAEQ